MCAAVVIDYQVTRPPRSRGSEGVRALGAVLQGLLAGFRTIDRRSVLPAAWSSTTGNTAGRISDSIGPAMVDLVVSLSPRFIRPYRFGPFRDLDAGEPGIG